MRFPKEQMKWDHLKDMHCPRPDCEGHILKKPNAYACDTCDFSMDIFKFIAVVDSLYKKPKKQPVRNEEEDNMKELNALGQEEEEELPEDTGLI